MRIILISMGFLLMMTGFVSAESESKTVKLSFTKSKSVLRLSWPMKLGSGGYLFNSSTKIYGHDFSLKTQKKGRSLAVNLTSNDGSFKLKPKIYARKPIAFNIPAKLGEKNVMLPLMMSNIFTSGKGKSEVYARYYPGWAMAGKVGKTKIYLIDANVDTKFDTNGRDYIAIGSSYAIKLCKQTVINGKLYEVSITSDGSELTLEDLKSEKLCKVALKAPKGLARWGVLSLSNNEGTYNIAAKNCNVLPAGTYKISYGIYGKGTNYLYLRRTQNFDPQLEIRAGNINTINIGAPFVLKFKATLTGKTVKVDANISVAGCYGESYRYRSSVRGRGVPPSVAIYAGKKRVSTGKMGFG